MREYSDTGIAGWIATAVIVFGFMLSYNRVTYAGGKRMVLSEGMMSLTVAVLAASLACAYAATIACQNGRWDAALVWATVTCLVAVGGAYLQDE